MKTLNEKIMLIITVGLFFAFAVALPCWAQEKAEKDIFEDERANRARRMELTEEKIEQILNHIREAKPEEAERLEKLREEDPEKFKTELREMVGRRLRGHREEKRENRDKREYWRYFMVCCYDL